MLNNIWAATTASTAEYVIAGILGGSTVTGLATLWFTRGKTAADTRKVLKEAEVLDTVGDRAEADILKLITETSGDLINQVREQAEIARKESTKQIEELREQNDNLLTQVTLLKEQTEKIPQLETDITALTKGVKLLTEQLHEHGISPIVDFGHPPILPHP